MEITGLDREELIREAMRAMGSATSDVKARSSRENGKKGGRPRKVRPGAETAAAPTNDKPAGDKE